MLVICRLEVHFSVALLYMTLLLNSDIIGCILCMLLKQFLVDLIYI